MVAADGVSPDVAAMISFDTYPAGPANGVAIQRVMEDMIDFGLLPHSFDVTQMLG